MGDSSGPGTLPTIPTFTLSQLRPRTLGLRLNRLPSGLEGMSKESYSGTEPYQPRQISTNTDPDPGRSRLCYECNTVMNNLHCHPWTDTRRVETPIGQTPIGEINHRYTSEDPRYTYRALRMAQCALCSMIFGIVAAEFCHNLQDRFSISEWRYLLKPTPFGKVFDYDPRRSFGQIVSTNMTRHARWYLGIEIDDLSGSKPPRLISNAIQGAIRPLPKPFRGFYTNEEQAIFEQRGFLNGRARDLQFDLELLKSWPRLCDRYHGPKCNPGVKRQEPNIRFIDTTDQCIVSKRLLDLAIRQDYVALSYVWGDVQQTYLPVGKAYSELFKKGALLDLRLSKTILDAMQLIKRFGLRYLWVDALCIDQDDFSDKEEQIARMGSVFQGAFFTIIAASGSDSDAGLPGLRPKTRFKKQQLVEAGNITLLSSVQHPYEKMLTPETSKWSRRAWTFQEDVLSRRRLIFTDEQVWWRCSCANWCEQSQLETPDAIGFLSSDQMIEPSFEERFSKLRPNDYFDIVSGYAQRELSYPSDAFNAFKGILSVLTDYSNEQFFWGFAISSFEQQLHWWAGKVKARTSLVDQSFPTWSWVAWEGDVSFRDYNHYDPVIACFTIRGDGKSQETAQLVCSPPTGFGARNYDLPLKDELTVSMDAIATNYPMHSLKSNFHIFFYTYSAMFYLMPQGRLIIPNCPPRPSYDIDGKIRGSKPNYGYLVPTIHEQEFYEKGDQECILLGRRPAPHWDEAHVVVMLITRKCGYAQRLGIADMSEDFWNLADRSWKLIALG